MLTFCLSFSQRSHSINLTLDGLKTLDIGIRRWYAQWIHEAPQTYKSDNFFLDRNPIAVTSIYGQNQQLAMWDDETDEDIDNWSRSRDFTKLKYVSVSIASHFEYVILFPHLQTFLLISFTESKKSPVGKTVT